MTPSNVVISSMMCLDYFIYPKYYVHIISEGWIQKLCCLTKDHSSVEDFMAHAWSHNMIPSNDSNGDNFIVFMGRHQATQS